MILQQLKSYIEAHPGCSVRELANYFDTREDAIRAMLEPWIKRGRLSRNSQAGCGGGCGCGADANSEYLYWSAPNQIGVNRL